MATPKLVQRTTVGSLKRCTAQSQWARPFSRTSANDNTAEYRQMDIKQSPEPSIRNVLKQAQKDNGAASQIGMDVGLIEGTFIMPTGSNRPSIFRAPRDRVKLEWTRVITRLQDVGSRIAVIRQAPKLISPLKWNYRRLLTSERREITRTALELHEKMYQALAKGNLDTISSICADGLRDSLRSRILSRGSKIYKWATYGTRKAQKVSDRAQDLGMGGMGMRQTVVRIRSWQSLARVQKDGTVVPGTGIGKEIKEYLVLQRSVKNKRQAPWLIWGTTEETTVDLIRSREAKQQGQKSEAERAALEQASI